MGYKARANARQRKGNRTGAAATATATRAMPVAATGTRPEGGFATVARSRQVAPTSTVAESSESSRLAQRKDLPRGARHATDSAAPHQSSQPAATVAIDPDGVVSTVDAQDGGELLADRLRRWLSTGIPDAGFTDDLMRYVMLTRTVVARYVRSGWFVAEVASIVGLFALCFGAPFDAAYFYRIAGLALGLVAVIGTYALDHAVAPPRWYVRHSLRTLGRPTVAPLVFAATVMRVVAFVLLLSLVLIFRRLTPIEPRVLLAGAVGLLANCALIASVAVACSTPFARRGVQLGLLTWLVVALATYGPDTNVSSPPVMLWVARLPLLPFAACFDFGVTGMIGWSGVAALVAEVGMIAAAVAIVDIRLRHRLHRREPSGAAR